MIIENASLNLTQNCNLACAYCFNQDKTTKKMSFETAQKCVNWVLKGITEANINQLSGRFRKASFDLWGGEPLLEWEMIQKVVLYSEDTQYHDVVVEFGGTTNGVLLTEDKFDFMADHHIRFMISLDGTQASHDYYRKFKSGQGSHAIIMKNVEKVLKRFGWLNVRMSPHPASVGRFYEDIKYLVDHGIYTIAFSPVYEADWVEKDWLVWEDQCMKVVDFIAQKRKEGKMVSIKHFEQYTEPSFSKRPCGAGTYYIGFDIDGAMEICHRFRKFNDSRPWQERENCIGHVDVGITRPEVRDKLINWKPVGCEDCKTPGTPCVGACPATNSDLTGDISQHSNKECKYVEMQTRVSKYFSEQVVAKTTTPQQVMSLLYELQREVRELKNAH